MSDIPEALPEAQPAAPAASPAPAPKRRSPLRRLVLMLAVPALVAGGAGYWFLSGAGVETTENANLRQAHIPVAASIGGRVTKMAVTELQHVKAGDVLFTVDDQPYKLALAQAEAALAAARLQVAQLKAGFDQSAAQAKLAEDNATFQGHELDRKEALAGKGVATVTDLDDARHLAQQAAEQAQVALLNVEAARAALGGDPAAPVDAHPAVQAALTAVDAARYNLSLTTVKAPADGVVYQAASFREGAMVSAGQSVFALVETNEVWVEANFKETQIGQMAADQKAEVEFDAAPGRRFEGTVVAVGAGTGAEFSLLPAQNATGNWVKVTQRVPVRIRLDHPEQVAGLATGLSASVTVETGAAPFMAAKAGE